MQTTVKTSKRQQAGERVTLVGAVVNVLLSALKISTGFLSGSLALIADGFHSLADLISDFAVVVLYRIANKKPDQNHPWGHARFETLGTIFVAVLLAAVGAGIFYRAIEQLNQSELVSAPGWTALVVAAISLIFKELLYQYTLAVGNKYNSKLIIANAWHHRTDMFSSALVFAAIAGAIAGVWWLDAIGALLVSLFLFWLAGKMLWESLTELVDTALPQQDIQSIKAEALQVPGVLDVRALKTRRAGPQTYIELRIQVERYATAAEANLVGHQVTARLKQKRNDLTHVIFQIEVEPAIESNVAVKPGVTPDRVRTFIKQQFESSGLTASNVRLDFYLSVLPPEISEEKRAKSARYEIAIRLPADLNVSNEIRNTISRTVVQEYDEVDSVVFYQQLS